MKQLEAFCESLERYRVNDAAGYIATGVQGPDRVETWNCLYRCRLAADLSGVFYELLATFTARIIQIELHPESGAVIFVLAGRGRYGEPFMVRIRERDFDNPRKFTQTVTTAAGPGSFIIPGMASATARAIRQLTAEGGPMPRPKAAKGWPQ